MTKEKNNYEKEYADLEKIIQLIQKDQLPMDEVLSKVESGFKLIEKLQKTLSETKHKIEKLQAKYDQ